MLLGSPGFSVSLTAGAESSDVHRSRLDWLESSLTSRRGDEPGTDGRNAATGFSHLPEVTISPAMHKTGAIVKVQISVRPVYDASRNIVAVEAMMRRLSAGAE